MGDETAFGTPSEKRSDGGERMPGGRRRFEQIVENGRDTLGGDFAKREVPERRQEVLAEYASRLGRRRGTVLDLAMSRNELLHRFVEAGRFGAPDAKLLLCQNILGSLAGIRQRQNRDPADFDEVAIRAMHQREGFGAALGYRSRGGSCRGTYVGHDPGP